MSGSKWKETLVAGLMLGASPVSGAEIEWRQLPPLPDAFGFASPFAGTSGHTLLVAGGANFSDKPLWEGGKKIWHDTIYALEPDARDWTRAGTLPGRLAYGVSFSTNDGLLCVGGSDAERHSSEVFLLRWEKNALTKKNLPALPRPMALSAGARVGDVLYLAGGMETPKDKQPLATFLALDLRRIDGGWKELPTWPGPPRFQPVAASDGGFFYLFSGLSPKEGGLEYLRDAYRYSPKDGWERLPDLPFPAAAASSPAPVGPVGIYLIGGVDGTAVGKTPRDFYPAPQRIQLYEPKEKRWLDAGNAPIGRVCVSASEWQGRWILPSGETTPGVRSPEVWSLRLP